MTEKTRWKLNDEQKELIISWVAQFPSNRAVLAKCRANDFPEITGEAVIYYRNRYGSKLAEIRERRRSEALETGWAKLEVRIGLLQELLDDWSSREQDKVATTMVLRIERQLAEELGAVRPSPFPPMFEEPVSMENLMKKLEERKMEVNYERQEI